MLVAPPPAPSSAPLSQAAGDCQTHAIHHTADAADTDPTGQSCPHQLHDLPDQGAVVPLTAEPEPTPARYRRPWAQLLARIFDRQVLVCPHCQGPMNRIQLVDDPAVIHRILTHLGLPTSLPQVAAARDPPQLELTDDNSFDL